ncbi:MAG: hypothetical protein LC808_30275, partial [Actinobacteria bacterium]|nr:hypothetical protein [Actinomycetota bacterium]
PGVTGSFQFSVGGQLFTVPVGQCTGPIEVPAGQVTVTEVGRPGFQVVTCTTFPAAALGTNCNQGNQTAVVNVAFGGISAQTALTFVNRAVPGTAAEEPSDSTPADSVAPQPSVVSDEDDGGSGDEPAAAEACEAPAAELWLAATDAGEGDSAAEAVAEAIDRLARARAEASLPCASTAP